MVGVLVVSVVSCSQLRHLDFMVLTALAWRLPLPCYFNHCQILISMIAFRSYTHLIWRMSKDDNSVNVNFQALASTWWTQSSYSYPLSRYGQTSKRLASCVTLTRRQCQLLVLITSKDLQKPCTALVPFGHLWSFRQYYHACWLCYGKVRFLRLVAADYFFLIIK